MEIIYAPAGNVYLPNRLPKGITPEKEIPVLIDFELEDLTPEKGYTVTDMDGLFRRLVEKLNVPFHRAQLSLPRRGELFSSIMRMGSADPLAFFAERGDKLHHVVEEKLKPYMEYNRHLFTSRIVFNELDTGKATLDDVLKYVRDKPVGEDLTVGLENARLSLHTGHNPTASSAESLHQSLVQHDRVVRNTENNIINVQLNAPWLSKLGMPQIGKEYAKESPKELTEIFESLIDSYFNSIRYRT